MRKILHGSAHDLGRRALLTPDVPAYLMLNLPYHCNYQCLKCCNFRDLPAGAAGAAGSALAYEEIAEIVRAASDLGITVLVLAGEGEPVLDGGFRHIVELATRHGLLPYIFTNASLLDRESAEFLADHDASLVISLDSIDPIRYARLTGGRGDLRRVLANIEACRQAYGGAARMSRLGEEALVSLAINTVVTSLNVGELGAIQEFCGDDIAFVCNEPTRIGLAEANWQFLYGDTTPVSDIRVAVDTYAAENGPLGTAPGSDWCAYMRNGVSVGSDGSILGCAYAVDTAGRFGQAEPSALLEGHRRVISSLDRFYELHGHSRCLLRHPRYARYLQLLSEYSVTMAGAEVSP